MTLSFGKITQAPWSLKGFSFLGLTEAGIPGSTEPFLTESQRTKCKLTAIANQMHNAKCKMQSARCSPESHPPLWYTKSNLAVKTCLFFK